MYQVAVAAVAAALLAAALTVGAWQSWSFARHQEGVYEGVGYPYAGFGGLEPGFSHNFYGWSYLYAYPSTAPLVATHSGVREDGR